MVFEIKRMQAEAERFKRKMALAKRERKAAERYRGSATASANQVYLYEEVPAWAVPPESREAADHMLTFCLIDLQLSRLQVRWCNEFIPGDPDKPRLFSEKTTFSNHERIGGCILQHGGVVIENTIWINYELDPEAIPRTVAHEARHCYQLQHQGTLKAHGKEADMEVDASRYAKQALDACHFFKSCPAYAFNRTSKAIKSK